MLSLILALTLLPLVFAAAQGEEVAPLESAASGVDGGAESPGLWQRLGIRTPLPAKLAGRIDFPAGLDASEYVVFAVPDGETSWMLRDQQPLSARIAPGGGYAFPPVAPGEYALYAARASGLTDASTPRTGVPHEAKLVDRVTLAEGASEAQSSVYPGGADVPVTFVLECALPAGGATAMVLATARGKTVSKQPAARGRGAVPLGRMLVEPGTYGLWVAGDGWLARGGAQEIVPADLDAEIPVEISVTKRRVRLMDGAQPLAQIRIFIMGVPREIRVPLETDKDGWLELTLGAGIYTLLPANQDRDRRPRPANVSWPLPDGQDEVRFEFL